MKGSPPLVRDLGVGVIVGLSAGWLAPLAPPASPAAPVAEAPPRVAAPRSCAERERALDQAWDALEVADARLRQLRANVEDLIGPRPEFVDPLEPDQVDAQVLSALADSEAELQWIDCSEAPCIAVLEVPREVWNDRIQEVGDAFRDAVGGGYRWEAFGVGVGFFLTVPLGEPPTDARLHHRVDLREELIIDELGAASRSGP